MLSDAKAHAVVDSINPLNCINENQHNINSNSNSNNANNTNANTNTNTNTNTNNNKQHFFGTCCAVMEVYTMTEKPLATASRWPP